MEALWQSAIAGVFAGVAVTKAKVKCAERWGKFGESLG